MSRPAWRWIPTGLLLAILVALAFFTHGFTGLPATYYMTGPSMEPGVAQGAWFLAGPLSGLPARGDLVVMQLRIDDTLFNVLRRAVALPGDTVQMVAGQLRVNGRPAEWPARIIKPQAERTLDGPVRGTIYNWGPLAVGPDSVFLLSDTRDMLGWPDSRFLGAVPRERIEQRYLLGLW